MSFDTIRQSLESYVNANWAGVPMAYDNVPFTPPSNGAAWVRMTIQEAGREIHEIGAVSADTVGLVSFQIFTPKDSGTAAARQIADQLATLLDIKNISGVKTQVLRLRKAGFREDYEQHNADVPFEFNAIV